MLDYELSKLGFFMCSGTEETIQFNKVKVVNGKPNRTGYNNSTYAVYDQYGRPWIANASRQLPGFAFQLEELTKRFNLEQGCYVPHSNDGGHFVINVLPTLVRR